MARPRKEPPTLDDMTQTVDTDVFYSRLAQLERAVGILSAYITERDQLRYVGSDAEVVGISRQFRK